MSKVQSTTLYPEALPVGLCITHAAAVINATAASVLALRAYLMRPQDGTSLLEEVDDDDDDSDACRKAVLTRGYSAEGMRIRANPHVLAWGLHEQYQSEDATLLDVVLQAEGAPGLGRAGAKSPPASVRASSGVSRR